MAIEDPLSGVFSNCFMNSTEKLVIPSNPTFYIRYVDDIYVRRNNDCTDSLFQAPNNYHPNIKLTLELSSSKFLDINIHRLADGTVRFSVVHKSTKLPFHYFSQVPTQYKECVIKGDLHRSEKIGSCYAEETNRIVMKYLKAGYPINFIKSQISIFSRLKNDYVIPKNMFDERIHLHLQVPYCLRNETMIFKVSNNIEEFTNFIVKVNFLWITNQMRSLFPLKDKISHPHSVIHKGTCFCSKTHIEEALRNAVVRWKEHEY